MRVLIVHLLQVLPHVQPLAKHAAQRRGGQLLAHAPMMQLLRQRGSAAQGRVVEKPRSQPGASIHAAQMRQASMKVHGACTRRISAPPPTSSMRRAPHLDCRHLDRAKVSANSSSLCRWRRRRRGEAAQQLELSSWGHAQEHDPGLAVAAGVAVTRLQPSAFSRGPPAGPLTAAGPAHPAHRAARAPSQAASL